MGLDYSHTCPEIDKEIENFKDSIDSVLSNMLDETNPLLEGKQKQDIIDNYVEDLYNSIDDPFESVRRCNEDMRTEADDQIETLEERVDELSSELDDRVDEIEDLTNNLGVSEERVRELEAENLELSNE